MSTFSYIVFSLIVLLGTACIIKSAFYCFLKTNTCKNVCSVILLSDNEINARAVIERIRQSDLKFKCIVAVDNGIEKEDKEAVMLLLKDYNIPLIKIEEVGEYLTK